MDLPLSPRLSSLVSPSIDVKHYYALHVTAAFIPLSAGFVFYGWAALATVSIVVGATAAALAIWQHIGRRGRQLNIPRCLWMSLLLGLMLPPHLVSPREGDWPIALGAGVFLVIVEWLLARIGSGRVEPMLAAYLILIALFAPRLTPHLVLKPSRMVVGNLFNADVIDVALPRTTPWVERTEPARTASPQDALDDSDLAGVGLASYTSGREVTDRFSDSALMVLRDRMPPLEDLVLGGEPAAVGTASGLALIIGGLLLIHRGLIDYRIPLLAIVGAAAGFLIFPVPVVITDLGPQWHWLAFRSPYLGWQVGLSLASYELFASPLILVAFFLATSARTRPMSGPARAVFGLLLGILTAVAQLYGSVAVGPYVALLLASLLSRTFDRLFSLRTLGLIPS
jgi:electron transport complex protein RnfD